MGLIDALALVVPSWAASYLRGRMAYLQAARLYEAATPSGYRPLRASSGDGDRVVAAAGARLRGLARHLDENHDLVIGIFDDLVNNTIGDGIGIDPMVRMADGKLAVDLNRELSDLWLAWSQHPETTGELGMPALERLAARSVFRDGEIFLRHVRSSRYRYAGAVPYVVDVMEADYCPMEYSTPADGITNGIARDAWGRPVRYYFYRRHPGASGDLGVALSLRDLVEVSASAVMHPKFTRRMKQARGVPIIHGVINRLRDVKDYEESERIAAKVAADMTAFIQRQDGAGASMATLNEQKKRDLRMSAGAIFELLPGETVGTIKSDRPNTGLEAFRNAMLRATAAGTGTRFSAIARDYRGTYSSQRQELVEGVIGYRALFGYLVSRIHRPIYETWAEAAILSGTVRSSLRGVDRATLARAEYRAPALPWINPKDEADAWIALVQAELESRAGVQRMRGRDPQRVQDEIEAEREAGFGIVQNNSAATGHSAGGAPHGEAPPAAGQDQSMEAAA